MKHNSFNIHFETAHKSFRGLSNDVIVLMLKTISFQTLTTDLERLLHPQMTNLSLCWYGVQRHNALHVVGPTKVLSNKHSFS